MMASKGFMFFDAYFYATTTMTDTQRLEFYDSIIRYAVLREEPDLDGLMSSTFELIRPAIDKSIEMRERGSRGGSAKRKTDADENDNCLQAKSKVLASKNESACNEEKGREHGREEKRTEEKRVSSRFAPPTVDDVKAYCFERGNNVDPQRFVDYYTSNGWKVGKNPMKDWKATVRNWETRDETPKKADKQTEIRGYYDQMCGLYPMEKKKDEGWDYFQKLVKGDPATARRIVDCMDAVVNAYYNGERCLENFTKDIEVAYGYLRS